VWKSESEHVFFQNKHKILRFCNWFSEAVYGGEVDPVLTSCTVDEIT